MAKLNIAEDDISIIVGTGYGRVSLPFADKKITEITCHGRGAYYINPDIRTIIDIGGQDSKVIKINERYFTILLIKFIYQCRYLYRY